MFLKIILKNLNFTEKTKKNFVKNLNLIKKFQFSAKIYNFKLSSGISLTKKFKTL